jgi:hypothetical protein
MRRVIPLGRSGVKYNSAASGFADLAPDSRPVDSEKDGCGLYNHMPRVSDDEG